MPIWEKFIFLVTLAGFTGAARLPIGPLWADEQIRGQFLAGCREMEQVARAEGVPVAADTVDRIAGYVGNIPGTMRSSLLIDLSQGKRIEVEALQGSVVRRAARAGVAGADYLDPVCGAEAVGAPSRLSTRWKRGSLCSDLRQGSPPMKTALLAPGLDQRLDVVDGALGVTKARVQRRVAVVNCRRRVGSALVEIVDALSPVGLLAAGPKGLEKGIAVHADSIYRLLERQARSVFEPAQVFVERHQQVARLLESRRELARPSRLADRLFGSIREVQRPADRHVDEERQRVHLLGHPRLLDRLVVSADGHRGRARRSRAQPRAAGSAAAQS